MSARLPLLCAWVAGFWIPCALAEFPCGILLHPTNSDESDASAAQVVSFYERMLDAYLKTTPTQELRHQCVETILRSGDLFNWPVTRSEEQAPAEIIRRLGDLGRTQDSRVKEAIRNHLASRLKTVDQSIRASEEVVSDHSSPDALIERTQIPHPGPNGGIRFSPDGQTAVWILGGEVRLWKSEVSQPIRTFHISDSKYASYDLAVVNFAPGAMKVIVSGGGETWHLDLETGKKVKFGSPRLPAKVDWKTGRMFGFAKDFAWEAHLESGRILKWFKNLKMGASVWIKKEARSSVDWNSGRVWGVNPTKLFLYDLKWKRFRGEIPGEYRQIGVDWKFRRMLVQKAKEGSFQLIHWNETPTGIEVVEKSLVGWTTGDNCHLQVDWKNDRAWIAGEKGELALVDLRDGKVLRRNSYGLGKETEFFRVSPDFRHALMINRADYGAVLLDLSRGKEGEALEPIYRFPGYRSFAHVSENFDRAISWLPDERDYRTIRLDSILKTLETH